MRESVTGVDEMNILKLKLIAWLTGQTLIWFIDAYGNVSLALAKKNPWGELCALIDCVIYKLKSDGSAIAYNNNGRNGEWKPYE